VRNSFLKLPLLLPSFLSLSSSSYEGRGGYLEVISSSSSSPVCFNAVRRNFKERRGGILLGEFDLHPLDVFPFLVSRKRIREVRRNF